MRPPSVQLTHLGKNYAVKSYATQNHVGINNGRAYGLGPFTDGKLTDFGEVSQYAAQACSLIRCDLSSLGTGQINNSVEVLAPTEISTFNKRFYSLEARRPLTGIVLSGEITYITLIGTVSGSFQSLRANAVYVLVEDSAGVFTEGMPIQLNTVNGGTALQYTVSLKGPKITQSGRYSGVLKVWVCLDIECKTRLKGAPVTVPYDFKVTTGISTGQDEIVIKAPFGEFPQPIQLENKLGLWISDHSSSIRTTVQLSELGAFSITDAKGVPSPQGGFTRLEFWALPPGAYTETIGFNHQLTLEDRTRISQDKTLKLKYEIQESGRRYALSAPSVQLTLRPGEAKTEYERLGVVPGFNPKAMDYFTVKSVAIREATRPNYPVAIQSVYRGWIEEAHYSDNALRFAVRAWETVERDKKFVNECLPAGIYTAKLTMQVAREVTLGFSSAQSWVEDVTVPVSLTVTPGPCAAPK